MNGRNVVPVVVFAYNRPDHLLRTLDGLRRDRVPRLIAFSDAPKTEEAGPAVESVRALLRRIDWCDATIVERPANLGLGRSVLSGVTDTLAANDAVIVFEDDLLCVEGTYRYLTAALEQYRNDDRVMSVTGWTHQRVTPRRVGKGPYFDGRGESWSWGTWSRSWQGMDVNAMTLLEQCRARGIDVARYGLDLIDMAEKETRRNIWAVRFILLHMLRGALCMRPPHSLIENIGFDAAGTNTTAEDGWSNRQLRPCPPIPTQWPEPIEHPDCARLWARVYGPTAPERPGIVRRGVDLLRRLARAAHS